MVNTAYKIVLILFQGRDQEKTPFVGTSLSVGGLLLFSDDECRLPDGSFACANVAGCGIRVTLF
jgi:hypothetical protein